MSTRNKGEEMGMDIRESFYGISLPNAQSQSDVFLIATPYEINTEMNYIAPVQDCDDIQSTLNPYE